MPDQGKRVWHQSIVVVKLTSSVPPRLVGILDGPPEGTRFRFTRCPGQGSGSIGDEKRGDRMAEFAKAPFHGAEFEKRGIVKGVVLLSRAAAQLRVEYTAGLLKDLVAGIAKDHNDIGKLNVQLTAMVDGDEATDLRALKELFLNKRFAINRELVHSGEYFTAYAEQTRMFDVRDAMVELTGILPRGVSQGGTINIARFYGREMHVLTILQCVGEVEPLILTILRTVWGRLEGMSGATFA